MSLYAHCHLCVLLWLQSPCFCVHRPQLRKTLNKGNRTMVSLAKPRLTLWFQGKIILSTQALLHQSQISASRSWADRPDSQAHRAFQSSQSQSICSQSYCLQNRFHASAPTCGVPSPRRSLAVVGPYHSSPTQLVLSSCARGVCRALYLQHLEQQVTPSGCLVNICWMDRWVNEWTGK